MCYLNWIFIPKNTKGGIFSQGIDLSISSIFVVLIQEMGVFTSYATSVGSGGLFMQISLKLLVIVLFFTIMVW